MTVRCPHCNAPLPEETVRAVAREYGSRPAKSGKRGRPKSDAPRCPCGASTLRLAWIRQFRCCWHAVATSDNLERASAIMAAITADGEI